MNEKWPQAGCQEISEMSPSISKSQRNLMKNRLFRGEETVDIEHIGVAGGINRKLNGGIDEGGQEAECSIKGNDFGKSVLSKVGKPPEKAVQSNKDQEKMPDKAVKGQGPVRI